MRVVIYAMNNMCVSMQETSFVHVYVHAPRRRRRGTAPSPRSRSAPRPGYHNLA